MVFLKDWDDFEIAAESMFMKNPGKCRFTLKYQHSKGQLLLKFTDNVKVSIFLVLSSAFKAKFINFHYYFIFLPFLQMTVYSI